MKRRDTLKALGFSGIGLGLAVNPVEAAVPLPPDKKVPAKVPGGRQPFEAERDAKLHADKFFTPQELKTVTILSDIILPADAKSGSASQAGVPAFIEFMMKDMPQNQTPMRGGLAWIDTKCRAAYGKPFAECTHAQQIELVDQIAYPQRAKANMSQGVAFFNTMRNFVMCGFYTSKMGIEDLGYKGNTPNQWEGVPEPVLKKFGLSYS